uniref:Uncharacterized protein n=1 Tax=viral metagenome TaxID=1070528 RepID=A0A6H1Z8J2_9ZZZZ
MWSAQEALRVWIGLSHACVREGTPRPGMYSVAVEGYCPFLKKWVTEQAIGETEEQVWDRLAEKMLFYLNAMAKQVLDL